MLNEAVALVDLVILTRLWSSLFVLLIVISLFSITETVQSQQYTTATITSLTTNTQSSTVAVGTQTQSTTQAQSASVISAPVTIPPTHGICGIYFQQAFKATAGSVITGTLNASSSVDLYVMSDTVFAAWSHQVVAGGTCSPANPTLSQRNTTSYRFTATIPADGGYEIIINNLSHSTITAQLNASLITTQPVLATITIYSTLTQESVQTIQQTTTETMLAAGPAIDPITIGIVILILVLLAIAAFVFVKRRSRKK